MRRRDKPPSLPLSSTPRFTPCSLPLLPTPDPDPDPVPVPVLVPVSVSVPAKPRSASFTCTNTEPGQLTLPRIETGTQRFNGECNRASLTRMSIFLYRFTPEMGRIRGLKIGSGGIIYYYSYSVQT